MKQSLISVCLLTLVITGTQAQTPNQSDPSPWKTYVVKDEQFSVALPALPAMDSRERFASRLRKSRLERMLGSYADGVVYTIKTFENPKPRQSLQEFVEEQKRSGAWDPATERDVTLNGFAGKELLSSDRNDGMAQFFVTEKRLYIFRAIGASADDARVKKFFSSLSLSRKKDGIEVSDGPGLGYEPVVESGAAGEKAFERKEVDKRARLAMKLEPAYTDSARFNKVTGTVLIKCVFRSNGTVTDIRVVSGLPHGLTESAIESARKIRFIPAIKDGKYVSVWMQLEYNFDVY